MAFKKEELDRIVATLTGKVPKPGNCPICGNENWEIGDSFVALTLQEDFRNLKLSGPMLPCLPITCTNCGNTHLLNLITLGLRDLFEKKKEEKPAENTKKKAPKAK